MLIVRFPLASAKAFIFTASASKCLALLPDFSCPMTPSSASPSAVPFSARADFPLLAQAFADQCRRWSAAAGAEAAIQDSVAQQAALVSQATSNGHVCIRLRGNEQHTARQLRQQLLASGIVTRASAGPVRPLVLDMENRLYLARYFDYEQRLAQVIRSRQADHPFTPGPAALAALDAAFAGSTQQPDWQKIACALALRNRLTIISGGPGTGKTTTVANLLACLLADRPDCRIALAAPTGKAAARLVEALRTRAASLPPEIQARLPQEASTVHRLLGIHPEHPRPRFHAGQPLPVDVLVVDEASMLDLSLAVRLVEAVPPTARLILLGDKDQLAAVEAGAVFAELSAQARLTPETAAALGAWCQQPVPATTADAVEDARAGLLADCVIWLRYSHRFGQHSPLGQLATAICQGDAETALAQLAARQADPAAPVRLVDDAATELPATAWNALQAACEDYIRAVQAYDPAQPDPAPVFAAFDAFRILCARRSGLRGVETVNRVLEARLRPLLSHPDDAANSPFYRGRPLIMVRNNVVTRLFNGDIGICLPERDAEGVWGLTACFPDPQQGFRRLPLARLPEHESAFALTVHKSQGSEFTRVAVIFPDQDGPLLSRELLYTAITRARQGVTLYAATAILAAAIERRSDRHNGLGSRLLEAGQGEADASAV